MNPIVNKPGTSRRVELSGNRWSLTPEPLTPTDSSSAIFAVRSGKEKLM